MAKIEILGTKYNFIETTCDRDSKLAGKWGYCDWFAKKIVIETDYDENDPDSISNFDAFIKQVKRHEVIHAYFAESGLKEYRGNEELIDWIAWNFPKMLESFKNIGAV